ncbi:MAG: cytochrome c biogenesis protein CcsA [Phycisphaerales bacterium]|jgi:cytochrome c-type biogenesis protein CcsB|nr:cytochrome c biogenesis protein CcsA [Phycisphaerales bacterium]
MSRSTSNILVFLFTLALSAGLFAGPVAPGPVAEDAVVDDWRNDVDLAPVGAMAVHVQGRIKSLASHANAMMDAVSGPRQIAGQSAMFTYLDMLFRPDAYRDADCIYIKNKLVRNVIAEAIENAEPGLTDRMEVFRASGLISPELLERPEVAPVLSRMESDLIRTAKQVDAIKTARAVMSPSLLLDRLRVIPPSTEDSEGAWHGLSEVMFLPLDSDVADAALEGLPEQSPIPGIDEAGQRQAAGAWRDLVNAWSAQDAVGINAAGTTLAGTLRSMNPEAYPSSERLTWENWYFEADQLTRGWLLYMFSIIFLLLGVVYRWKWAMWTGFAIFFAAFGVQTFALGLRWWIADRWPNSNMFEAVTTASWFGVLSAVLLEVAWLRKTAFRGLIPLGAAATAMVALMTASFLPVYLNPNISNMMPVLHDVWLYIHTNVIIFSYALIFMASVTATLYLAYRLFGGKAVYARAGGAGALVLAGSDGHTLASLDEVRRRDRLGEILDGSTMLLMELSFVLLWTGLVMGAIWADHSWGRPWGWDPKEVFALNTFVIFAILVHVRLKARDKGLWTAILAVIGCGVMLFNWIVINFVITGLHSYA